MLCCVSKRAVDGDHGPPYESRTRAEPLPALLEKIEVELYPEEDVPPILLPCATCARTFMPQSLEKHRKICERAAKKRKPFDSAKQRIQGTELAAFLPKQEKRRHEDSKPNNRSAWKQTHDEFLRTIRTARGVAVATPTQRQASSQITAGPPTRANENGTCPTCSRHFGIKAYDRHVAWCKERSTRLPVNPATNLAKERFEARMNYRAPGLKTRKLTNREKYSPGSATALSVANKSFSSSKPSSPPQQVRPKESVSLPNCNKASDSVVKQQRPVVVANRRVAQSREPVNSSGPMKSRVADRTNRQAKSSIPTTLQTPGPSHLASPVRGTATHYPVHLAKPKRDSIAAESSKSIRHKSSAKRNAKESTIKSAQNGMNSSRAKDESKGQPVVSARSLKTNIVSARSQGYPRINGVAVNNELMCMTIQPCIIYKEEELVTWKQISRDRCSPQDPDAEKDSSSDHLLDFRLPDMEEHSNDEIRPDETIDLTEWQRLDRTKHQRKELKGDKVYEERKLRSGRRGNKETDTRDFTRQEGNETKETTFKDLNAVEIEAADGERNNMSKWVQVTKKLNQTYLITDSVVDDSAFVKGNVDGNDDSIDSPMRPKSNSVGSDRSLRNSGVEEKMKMFRLIDDGGGNRSISTECVNGEKHVLVVGARTLLDSFEIQDDFIANEKYCNDDATAEDFTRLSAELIYNESFEIVNVSPGRSSTPIEAIAERNKSCPCNSDRSARSSVSKKDGQVFPRNFKQTNDVGSMSSSGRNDERNGSISNDASMGHAPRNYQFTPEIMERANDKEFEKVCETDAEEEDPELYDLMVDRARRFGLTGKHERTHDSPKSEISTPESVCSDKRDKIRENASSQPTSRPPSQPTSRPPSQPTSHPPSRPTSQPHFNESVYDMELTGSDDHKEEFVKVCETDAEEEDREVYHWMAYRARRFGLTGKHERTHDSPKSEISTPESVCSDKRDKIRENASSRPTNCPTSRENVAESAYDMELTEEGDDDKICEKYRNENFEYDSEGTPGEHTSSHSKNISEGPSAAPMKSSLKRVDKSRVDQKQPVSDSRVKLYNLCLSRIAEHESSRDENRLTSGEMQRKVRRTMHLLRDSTDTLISLVEATNAANYKHANVVNVVEVETVGKIDRKTKRVGFRTLPEICNKSKEIGRDRPVGKLKTSTMTFWETLSNVKKNQLINLDPPQDEKYRLPMRNPKIRILPPVPSDSTKAKRSGSNDYDPFMLAEQQMSELLSDTSDQSDLTSSARTNKDDLFPLTHSSAFVKYPFELTNGKRTSLIAPPTEFDDLTSDFSSDSTETNSLSREIFLGELCDSTETSEKKASPMRELGRRVIIDKSKALGSNVVDGKGSVGGGGERARKILDKATPKVVRPVANRSHSLRASSAPKSTPDRKSNNSHGPTLSGSRRPANYQVGQCNRSNRRCSEKDDGDARNNSYAPLSGSNLSLNSIISSEELEAKRSNSVFDELMTSFEDDRTSFFPSLKSFLKDDSLPAPSPPPTLDARHRNGNGNGNDSDEELSSPDSYKRQQEHGKLSADSAYSSLNRKHSNHGRSTNDVARFEEDGLRNNRRATIEGDARYKLSKFCHECGMRFPETAKFCCECGVKRLAL